MRDYGKVHTSFWTSANIRELSEDGRALAIYLLTCPHGTIAGVFRLPDGYASEDLQWSADRVQATLSELLANGFATRCEATKWVWVVKHLEWNPPENPNQKKAASKVAAQVPDSCQWKANFIGKCGVHLGMEPTPKANPSGTLSKPFLNQEQEQEQEQLPPTPKGVEVLAGFAKFWETWPSGDRKQAKGKCLEAWKKAKAEADAALVVAHVCRMLGSREWTKNGGEFIPAPLVYLSQKRWDGANDDGLVFDQFAGSI